MASYLRPRRGKKATAIAQLNASAPLKRGEVFFEVPDAGTGTGAGRIKMGDGSTAYESLPYFLEPFDPDSATVGFTNSTAAESDPYTTNATHANAIVPSANLKTIFTNLKQLLLNYNSQFTKLNNDLADTNSNLGNYSLTSHTHDNRYYTESEIDSKLGSFAPLGGATFSGNVIIKNLNTEPNSSIGVGATSYALAQIVLNSNYGNDNSKRAGIGFHNQGRNGEFLWLDTDGKLKKTNSGGGTVNMIDSSCFSLSGTTLTITT